MGVEGACDVDDGGGGADLDGAQEEAHGGEAGEVAADRVQGDEDAPEHAHGSEVLGQMDALHQERGRELAKEVTEAIGEEKAEKLVSV